MMAQQRRVEVISNNLANVNTTAFKRSRAHFEDLLYQTVQGPGVPVAPGAQGTPVIQVGRGTRLTAVQRVDAQGGIEPTGRPLDFAIAGDGYFQVRLPDGRAAYTRDGSFNISAEGLLVTQSGYTIDPELIIPQDATELSVSKTGVVTMKTAYRAEPIELGRIELARFLNSPGLEAMGENLLVETEASGRPIYGFPQEEDFGRILQHNLETSNVQIVQEMVEMITALRAYEVNSKAIRTSEQMSEIANSMVR
jgi:flagellar basal-body rod protein FlgG